MTTKFPEHYLDPKAAPWVRAIQQALGENETMQRVLKSSITTAESVGIAAGDRAIVAQTTAVTAQDTADEAIVLAGDASVDAEAARTAADLASLAADAATTAALNANDAAAAAAGIADGKGKVIIQSAAPDVEDQLVQNLWIDTTGGANTPKKWDGSAWAAVSDKAATDAAADAAIAYEAATQAAIAASVSKIAADNAQGTANTALTTANGKNKIIRSTSDASGTGYTNGDVWFKMAAGLTVGQWIYNNGWESQQIDNVLIANLDAAKITAGVLSADRIAGNSITGAKLTGTAIDGMTITGALIRTAASGQRVQIDSSGLRGFDAVGDVVTSVGTDGKLRAVNATVSGTFQTTSSSTAARIEVTQGIGRGEINFYDGTQARARIFGTQNSVQSSLRLILNSPNGNIASSLDLSYDSSDGSSLLQVFAGSTTFSHVVEFPSFRIPSVAGSRPGGPAAPTKLAVGGIPTAFDNGQRDQMVTPDPWDGNLNPVPTPRAGDMVFRTDKGWVEAYFPTYGISGAGGTSPGGATPAGWYPIAGKLPAFLTYKVGSQNGVSNPPNWTLLNPLWGGASPAPQVNQGFLSFGAGGLRIAQTGLYQIAAGFAMTAGGSGNRGLQITKNSTTADSGVLIKNEVTGFNGSASTIVRLEANDIIRVFAATGGNTGAIGVVTGDTFFSANYIGPVA